MLLSLEIFLSLAFLGKLCLGKVYARNINRRDAGLLPSYDFVIVGRDIGRLVAANRLSENPGE